MKQTAHFNSIEKALQILLAFQAERTSWGVRELSAQLGFSPATVQRILQVLKANGFVEQDAATRQYRLGFVYYGFLHALKGTYPITRASQPFMQRLVTRTRETVHLNIREGTDRVCIDNMESPQTLKATMPIGSRSPLYAGGSSKCLLAFCEAEFREQYLENLTAIPPLTHHTVTDLDALRAELAQIAAQGYAVSLGERNPGLGSLSAPVFNHRGQLLATLSLALPEIRYKDDRHREFCLQELCQTAREFSQVMGHDGELQGRTSEKGDINAGESKTAE
jgi:DNA-binding IclR family transcriptional regulator